MFGKRIEPSPSARNIGAIFDMHMILDKHVIRNCKACFFHLGNISKIRERLSIADTEKLVHAVITSKLDNANSLLYGMPKFLIEKTKCPECCFPGFTRTKKYERIKPVLKQLHWPPVNRRINHRILLLTHNDQAPRYIAELLKPCVPTGNLRSSSNNLL